MVSSVPAHPIPSGTVDVRVRYAEVDAFGYLHHSNYFVFLEMARTELLMLNGVRYRDMEERGLYYVVSKIECRYRAPARYDDLIHVTATTEKITRVRVDHTYTLIRDQTLLAEARSTLVLVGRDGRPTGLPDDLWEILTRTSPAASSAV